MILSELIERVKLTAIGMGNPDPRLLDSEVLVELVLPRVFSIVTQNTAKDPNALAGVRKDHTLSFVDGVAPFPEDVREEFTDSIYFPNVTQVSFIRGFDDWNSTAASSWEHVFTVQQRNMYFTPTTGFVSLIGSPSAAGIYTPRGTYQDTVDQTTNTYYVLLGRPDSDIEIDDVLGVPTFQGGSNCIIHESGIWIVNDDTGTLAYFSNDDVTSSMTWTDVGGGLPAPTTSVTAFTGDVLMNAITIPTLPTLVGDTVVAKDNILEEVIMTAAAVVTKQISLTAISLDYPTNNTK